MNQPRVYMCPLPPPSPSDFSGSSQCTGFECPVSCIELGLVIYFTYGNIHDSVLFSQIISPLSSPTESKSLFFTSVSLLRSCIRSHHYHLSKFHIYALIYCIGISQKEKHHSSILALRIPWTEGPGGLQSMGLQRVGHDWATNTFTFHFHYTEPYSRSRASWIVQLVKNPPAMQETPVWFLGQEAPPEKGQATHSSIHGLLWWLKE